MNITAKRERLHQFIDIAHKADIDVLLTYAELSMRPTDADDKWEDEAFVAEVQRSLKEVHTVKGPGKASLNGMRKAAVKVR